MNAQETGRVKFSLPSLIALVAAIFSFTTGAFWGFVLAAVAIVFGVLGMIVAFAPSRRGGLLSIFAVLAGVLGVVAAVFKAALWLL